MVRVGRLCYDHQFRFLDYSSNIKLQLSLTSVKLSLVNRNTFFKCQVLVHANAEETYP